MNFDHWPLHYSHKKCVEGYWPFTGNKVNDTFPSSRHRVRFDDYCLCLYFAKKKVTVNTHTHTDTNYPSLPFDQSIRFMGTFLPPQWWWWWWWWDPTIVSFSFTHSHNQLVPYIYLQLFRFHLFLDWHYTNYALLFSGLRMFMCTHLSVGWQMGLTNETIWMNETIVDNHHHHQHWSWWEVSFISAPYRHV